MTLDKFEKKLAVLSARGDSFAVAKFFKNNFVFVLKHRSEVEKIVRALDCRPDNIQNKE